MIGSRWISVRKSFFLSIVVVGTVLLVLAAAPPRIAAAPETCPLKGKQIRWIVPNALGGGYDTYSRLIEPYLERQLQAEITVENIPGAGGMIGAIQIKTAKPDGLTIGILDGSGMLVASLSGEENAPDLSEDFTILSRIARSHQVWATSADGPLRSMDDVLRANQTRPIVFGTLNVASLSFYNIAVASHLLGLDAEIVTGYRGSRAGILAVQRGEIEIISYSFESILRHIESGDVRPLMQISAVPIASHPALENVPLLGGQKGLAAQHAKVIGQDPQTAQLDVETLAAIIGIGRLIVAPKGLDPEMAGCLEQALRDALADPGLKRAAAKAKRTFDISSGKAVRQDLDNVSRRVERFAPLIQQTIRKVRN